MSRLLQRGSTVKSKLHHYVVHILPKPISLASIKLKQTKFLWYSPDNIFKIRVTAVRSKIKSRSHRDIANLHTQLKSSPSINFLRLTTFKIQPDKIYQDKIFPTNILAYTHIVFKGCRVKQYIQRERKYSNKINIIYTITSLTIFLTYLFLRL